MAIGILNVLFTILWILIRGSNVNAVCQAATDSNTSPGSCDFSNGSCGYTLGPNWSLQRGTYGAGFWTNTRSVPGGHTNGSSNDQYAVFIKKAGLAEMRSPHIAAGNYCLSFWYILSDQSVPLNVSLEPLTYVIWNHTSSSAVLRWTQVTLDVQNTHDFQVVFNTRLTGWETVGIDDIVIDTQVPFTSAPPTQIAIDRSTTAEYVSSLSSSPGSCSFSLASDTCGYNLDAGWSTQNGDYMYHNRLYFQNNPDGDGVYAIFNRNSTDTAIENKSLDLTSPVISSGSYILSFWFAKISQATFGEVLTITWNEQQNIFNITELARTWKKETLFYSSSIDFQLVFRVDHPNDHDFLAIDNISVVPSPGSCSFSSVNDTCGYTFVGWSVQQGDYVRGTIHYFQNNPNDDNVYAFCYADSTNNSTALDLTSPCLPAGTYNLSFWSIKLLQFTHVNVLTVSGSEQQSIFTFPSESERIWHKYSLDISSQNDFKLVFRVNHANSLDVVGIDKIELLPITARKGTKHTSSSQAKDTSVTLLASAPTNESIIRLLYPMVVHK